MKAILRKDPAVIVVGATGYLGKPLFAKLSTLVPTLGTTTTSANGLIHLRLENPFEFDYNLLMPGDTVCFTAAMSSPDVCANQPQLANAVNVHGTSVFIDVLIKKGIKVIFFSSDTVYGERADRFDETAICNPLGDYAIMKHEVESRFLGNPLFKTIRISYVFSFEDRFTSYILKCGKANLKATIYHPFLRAVVHRDDVVDGVISIATQWDSFPAQIINVGGPELLSRVDLVEILRDNHQKNIDFETCSPSAEYFANRPRVINMTSNIFPCLLSKPPKPIIEAVSIESVRPIH